jgi:hypothetical protein
VSSRLGKRFGYRSLEGAEKSMMRIVGLCLNPERVEGVVRREREDGSTSDDSKAVLDGWRSSRRTAQCDVMYHSSHIDFSSDLPFDQPLGGPRSRRTTAALLLLHLKKSRQR